MSIENKIKETKLVLESIMKISDSNDREYMLDCFVRNLVQNSSDSIIRNSYIPTSEKIKNTEKKFGAEAKQFPKIAELIELEIDRIGYPKDLKRYDVYGFVMMEIHSVGILSGSEEEEQFIDYLLERWQK